MPIMSGEPTTGAGQPLDSGTRAYFEPRLGFDLSDVRPHSDANAAGEAQALNARAFTVGRDIFFGTGQLSPNTRPGQHLLAHELVHVVQQQGRPVALQRQPAAKPQEMVLPEDVISVQPVEELPPETISGTRDQPGHLIETAHNVSNRARINAVELATQVESACQAFKLYTDPKLKELENEITASDLVLGLGSIVANAVGGALASKVANQLGRQLVTQITRQLVKAVDDKAKAASPEKKDERDLRTAVDSIAMGARDSATAITDLVSSTIDPPVNDIVNTVNAGKALSTEQEAFIGPFCMAPDDVVDTFLEGYGIPNGASAKALQLDVYQALVEKFEEKLIWAKASFRERLEMGFAADFGATELTLGYKAGQAAQQARQVREREMNAPR